MQQEYRKKRWQKKNKKQNAMHKRRLQKWLFFFITLWSIADAFRFAAIFLWILTIIYITQLKKNGVG